jgi:alkaline phosphatase
MSRTVTDSAASSSSAETAVTANNGNKSVKYSNKTSKEFFMISPPGGLV